MDGAEPRGAPALWIFGYGSLLWRPSFPFVASRTARIRGYRRVFWQGSTDHRGVPGAPGRVVTVVADRGACCDGRVFGVAAGDRDEVLATLDHREKGGYERRVVDAFPNDDAPPLRALLYAATAGNREYLGPAPRAAIARQVAGAHGPSGPNSEYVVRLAEALREQGAHDPEVFALEAEVRALLAATPGADRPEP